MDEGNQSGVESIAEPKEDVAVQQAGQEDCGLPEISEVAPAALAQMRANRPRRVITGDPFCITKARRAKRVESEVIARPQDCEQAQQSSEAEKASFQELKDLFFEQDQRCALSGIVLTTATMELGHIIPVSEGGTDAIDNLMWVHTKINRMQGTMGNDEFKRLCRLVSQWSG